MSEIVVRQAQPVTWTRLAPILFFEVYLNLSLVFFLYGPWQWPIDDVKPLLLFVLLAHAGLLLGYLSAAFRAPLGYRGWPTLEALRIASVALSLGLFVPSAWYLTRGGIDLLGALLDPASAYASFGNLALRPHGTALVTYVRTLCGPLLALSMPLVARSWRTMTPVGKVAGLLAIASNTSLFVLTGRNKGLVDLLLLLPWLYAISRGLGSARPRWWRLLAVAAVFVSLGTWFVVSFTRNQVGRFRGNEETAFTEISALGGLRADPENAMIRPLPPALKGVVTALVFNQTHGYVALAWALEKPFLGSWGVGNSLFLYIAERRLTGRSTLQDRSYPSRLERENDLSATEQWHTAYTWFASDLSFPGTILLMVVIGRLFARTWLDTLRGDNPYAIGVFLLLVTMLYYLPTSNIVLGFAETFTAFWALLAAWLLTRESPASGAAESPA